MHACCCVCACVCACVSLRLVDCDRIYSPTCSSSLSQCRAVDVGQNILLVRFLSSLSSLVFLSLFLLFFFFTSPSVSPPVPLPIRSYLFPLSFGWHLIISLFPLPSFLLPPFVFFFFFFFGSFSLSNLMFVLLLSSFSVFPPSSRISFTVLSSPCSLSSPLLLPLISSLVSLFPCSPLYLFSFLSFFSSSCLFSFIPRHARHVFNYSGLDYTLKMWHWRATSYLLSPKEIYRRPACDAARFLPALVLFTCFLRRLSYFDAGRCVVVRRKRGGRSISLMQ